MNKILDVVVSLFNPKRKKNQEYERVATRVMEETKHITSVMAAPPTDIKRPPVDT